MCHCVMYLQCERGQYIFLLPKQASFCNYHKHVKRVVQEEYKAAVKGDSLLLSSNWAAYLEQGPITFT